MFGMFRVYAGDFQKGNEHQFIGGKLLMKRSGKFLREKVALDQLQLVEKASEESRKHFAGTVGWGIAGGLMLGPIGLLAGLLVGGKGKDVTFICKLKDGRKFMAVAPASIFTQLSSAVFSNAK